MKWNRSAGPYLALLVIACSIGLRGVSAQEESDGLTGAIKALPTSKVSLEAGIQQASAKGPGAAISAKFELDDKAELSLSVYTAELGLDVDAEHNVLKELAASPVSTPWTPEPEVFKDVPHVSRASEQLALMALSSYSLVEIVHRAGKEHPGTVFSITPTLIHRKPRFVVLIAERGKIVEIYYNLLTGKAVKA